MTMKMGVPRIKTRDPRIRFPNKPPSPQVTLCFSDSLAIPCKNNLTLIPTGENVCFVKVYFMHEFKRAKHDSGKTPPQWESRNGEGSPRGTFSNGGTTPLPTSLRWCTGIQPRCSPREALAKMNTRFCQQMKMSVLRRCSLYINLNRHNTTHRAGHQDLKTIKQSGLRPR